MCLVECAVACAPSSLAELRTIHYLCGGQRAGRPTTLRALRKIIFYGDVTR